MDMKGIRVLHALPDDHVAGAGHSSDGVADALGGVFQVVKILTQEFEIDRGGQPGVQDVADDAAGLERQFQARQFAPNPGPYPIDEGVGSE